MTRFTKKYPWVLFWCLCVSVSANKFLNNSLMTQREITQKVNQIIASVYDEWQIIQYGYGVALAWVELFRPTEGTDPGKSMFLLINPITLNHTPFLQGTELKNRGYSMKSKIYLLEDQKKILVIQSMMKPQFLGYTDELIIQPISDVLGFEKVNTMNHEYFYATDFLHVIISDCKKYLGFQISKFDFCILDIENWSVLVMLNDISLIPFVQTFVVFEKNKDLSVVVLRIQHETAAYCRERIGVWVLHSDSSKRDSLIGTYICEGGLESYSASFTETTFILSVKSMHSNNCGVEFALNSKSE